MQHTREIAPTGILHIRELMEFITNECSHTYNVASLAGKIKSERFKNYVKRQIKGIIFSDIICTAIGIATLKQKS